MSMPEKILGFSVYSQAKRQCAEEISSALRAGGPVRVAACLNPHSYAESRNDPEFAAALQEAAWLLPDGAGIVVASRLLGGAIRHRITGSDLFHELNSVLAAEGGATAFLLGSTNQVLRTMAERMRCEWPQIYVAGCYAPPMSEQFSDREIADIVEAVNAAQADILWLGLGAPKQEKLLYRTRDRLNVRVAVGVGAVFDYYSGSMKRAHPSMQRLNLEWMVRFWKEPRRLWRRYLISLPIFCFAILAEVLRLIVHPADRRASNR